MSSKEKSSSLLAITISILGILTIALFFGLLLMQKKENDNLNIAEALSMAQPPKAANSFDPASWAQESVDYPPLQKQEESANSAAAAATDNVYSYDEKNALPEEHKETAKENRSPTISAKPVVKKVQPIVKTIAKPRPSYRKVSENGYWIQVFATQDMLRAEEIREDLVSRGIPATIQIYSQGTTRKYRIRIGAFNNLNEAENLAATVRQINGLENSFVIMSPVTRQIPIG